MGRTESATYFRFPGRRNVLQLGIFIFWPVASVNLDTHTDICRIIAAKHAQNIGDTCLDIWHDI
jgi:hypothetical protein